MVAKTLVLQKCSPELLLGPSQPAAELQRLNWAAPTGLQEVSTDPEKLGPRAADVGGKKMLQLLNDVSGAFRPGILTALVGSSGAGKTTLMDVLAGRKTSESPCSCKVLAGLGVERGRRGVKSWRLGFQSAACLPACVQGQQDLGKNGFDELGELLWHSWVLFTCEGHFG